MANQRLRAAERERIPGGGDPTSVEFESGTFANDSLRPPDRTAPAEGRPSAAPTPRSRRFQLLAAGGIALVGLFLTLAALGAAPARLKLWQQGEAYKLFTGIGLLALLAFQWILSLSRVKRWSRLARSVYTWHQLVGAIAPALLFLHSYQLGYGSVLALSIAFLLNNALGLSLVANPRWPKPLLSSGIVVHVALSLLVVALAGYHGWTALYYD